MITAEYIKWFFENKVAGEQDPVQGIFNYTVGDYSLLNAQNLVICRFMM